AQPLRDPADATCTMYSLDGLTYPPLPSPTDPYQVRVTVSSTTDSFYAQVVGAGSIGPSGVQTNATAPACVRPGGDAGMLTCSQAIATVLGSSTFLGTGVLIPVVTADCQVQATGLLFELWGSKGGVCGLNFANWSSIVDFTTETKWCDNPTGGSSSNP